MNNRYVLFLLFLVCAIVCRFFTFFPLVIDHDESTYLIMAQSWLRGDIPFVDMIDIKPVGIYAIFAMVVQIFGAVVWPVRLLACVSIAISALFVFKIAKKWSDHMSYALATVLIFMVCLSLHKWSWASNTELFFLPCALYAFYVLFDAPTKSRILWAGFILGVGFIIKYHILFEVVAFGVSYLCFVPAGKKIQERFFELCLAAVLFLLPIAMCMFYYFIIGHWDAFVEVSWQMPRRYSSAFDWAGMFSFAGEFLLGFIPLVLIFIYQLLKKNVVVNQTFKCLILWFCMAFLAITITGKFYFHYYIQMVAPAVLLFSYALGEKKWWFRPLRVKGLAAILVIACLLNQYMALKIGAPDPNRLILKEIEALPQSQNLRLFSEFRNILYFKRNQTPPTAFPHSSILYKEDLQKAFGVRKADLYQQIFNAHPDVLIIGAPPNEEIQKRLDNYKLIKRMPAYSTQIWRRL